MTVTEAPSLFTSVLRTIEMLTLTLPGNGTVTHRVSLLSTCSCNNIGIFLSVETHSRIPFV